MSQTVWFISYTLAEGASVEEYLAASRLVHDEILSQQKGFVSWKVLADGDKWVDLVTWESLEDAKNAETAGAANPAAHHYYSLINMESCQNNYYTVKESY